MPFPSSGRKGDLNSTSFKTVLSAACGYRSILVFRGRLFILAKVSDVVAFASYVCKSLVVLVIALMVDYEYTCFNIKRKELDRMPETKNLCAQIPIELYGLVNDAKAKTGQTTNEYITDLLTEYFEMKRNGGNTTMTGNTRTMALQISEELFQRIKAHLERESIRLGRKLTQREFVLGLIEEALNDAEQTAGEDNSPISDEETAAVTEGLPPEED